MLVYNIIFYLLTLFDSQPIEETNRRLRQTNNKVYALNRAANLKLDWEDRHTQKDIRRRRLSIWRDRQLYRHKHARFVGQTYEW